MRRFLIASALLLASVSGPTAAPMSTSDVLRPGTAATQIGCYRTCTSYGYCGYGYSKYKCCKYWKRVCH